MEPVWKFGLDQNFPEIPNPGSTGFHLVSHGWLPTEIGRAKTRNLVPYSVPTPDQQVQTGWGSAPAPDLFFYICRVNGDNISKYKETCELLLDYPKIGGGNIKDFLKRLLGIFCMPNSMYIPEYWFLSSHDMEWNELKNFSKIVLTWIFWQK